MYNSNSAASTAPTTSGGRLPSSQGHKQTHRYSSRSNSVSSASVVTITRAGSLSSQGAPPKGGPMGSQSPSDTSLLALRVHSSNQMLQDHKRRKSVAVDPSEYGTAEGLGNLNRWSQSTGSSVTNNVRRSRASSGAALASIAHPPPSARQIQNPLDHSPRASPQRRPLASSRERSQRRRFSPASSPERGRFDVRAHHRTDTGQKSLTALPPLHITPSLTDANDIESPSTNQTDTPATSVIATPSTHSTYASDYFAAGETTSPRSQAKRARPVMVRQTTAPSGEAHETRMLESEEPHHARHRSRHSTHIDDGSAPSAFSQDGTPRKPRTRERTEKDKKAMLSKALQKANTAVLLDNAQNFEGALDAYSDACRLLQMVMDRSSGPDDKRKLEAIKITYSNRIDELKQLEGSRPSTADEKGLPARPMSDDSLLSPATATMSPIDGSMGEPTVYETAQIARALAEGPSSARGAGSSKSTPTIRDRDSRTPRLSYAKHDRDSFFSKTVAAVEDTSRRIDYESQAPVVHDESSSGYDEDLQQSDDALQESIRPQNLPPPIPTLDKYTPAPLLARRPPSPKRQPPEPPEPSSPQELPADPLHESEEEFDTLVGAERDPSPEPVRKNSNASVSWLDTIDESGSSCSETESMHSVDAAQGVRRKRLKRLSGESNPDFDAAFDAAVEAAYNEGYEPDLGGRNNKKLKIAVNHARQLTSTSVDIKEVLSPTNTFHPGFPEQTGLDDEEEERLLDEITQDYAQGFNFDLPGMKSALPRQSDSSSYSRSTRSTWQSSGLSDRNTAGTSLSTVGEESLAARVAQPLGAPISAHTVPRESPAVLGALPPAAPPPTAALPKPPVLRERRASVASTGERRASTVRARRLSGHIPKPLMIETSDPQARKRASTFHHPGQISPFLDDQSEIRTAVEPVPAFEASLDPTASEVQHQRILRSAPSLDLRSQASLSSIPATVTTTSTLTGPRLSQDDVHGDLPSVRPAMFKKTKSSLSLREQHLVLSSPEELQASAVTPLSSTFLSFGIGRKHSQDPLTSQRAQFQPAPSPVALNMQYPGGAFLFDTSLSTDLSQNAKSPRSPNPIAMPVGLEPCPESFLLRPFWLLRTICQTLVHPRGGFLTTQLFVPRDVWQTHGVKLKATEEKVANCDLLTAALGRLAGVDSYDADALAEELQGFENVMERVQAALLKKVGNEVGVHGVQGIFKDVASATPTSGSATDAMTSTAEKTNSKGKESKSFSWRKLRSKSSGTPLGINSGVAMSGHSVLGKVQRELPNMPSVPMTSFVPVERRGGKRDVRNFNFEGPNRDYMSSLARLFEGAQVLDQIARQVEDPGLKHSSPTHVGLELSIRHAAEFFGFFVCRFVLNDLGILLDKFVKRGTEWVLV